MKKILMIFVLALSTTAMMLGQTVQISGTVTSKDDGLSIPGVSVAVPGTTIGVFTDINGNFSLNVPQNARNLVFSFIGMKTQEVAITGRSVIDIVMEQDLLNLDEVIVTGVAAGTPKKKMAVSVERVDEDKLKEVTAYFCFFCTAGEGVRTDHY